MSVPIIGVMSGSSLDGLDMALCHFDNIEDQIKWTIESARTIDFTPALKNALHHAPTMSAFELMELDAAFGTFIGEAIHSLVDTESVTAQWIASHGHTVFHEPSKKFTTQIGSGAHIAYSSGIDTITNFRAADVAAGGQGAPFAPIADKALFPGYDAYINLGGIVNISMVDSQHQWKGWDIGPCNQALNYLAGKLDKPYDINGQMAAQGKVNGNIVNSLMSMYPFEHGHPKGLSNAEVQRTWLQYLESCADPVVDVLASTTEAIAGMIAGHLQERSGQVSTILITGGGAHNQFLISRIKALGDHHFHFTLPAEQIIDYKECLLMAYLGYLTINSIPYGIHAVTGAKKDSIGGAIHKAHR
jgi:anhydro-N-acetylmuramic acid kinase